jgi:hypothetical protein
MADPVGMPRVEEVLCSLIATYFAPQALVRRVLDLVYRLI